MKEEKDSSGLLSAVEALIGELRRFETTAENLDKTPLNSQKNLERAAKLLTQVAESDQRLEESVRTLVVAISAMRERQQQQAEGVRNRALELQARTQTFTDLMTRYGQLGKEAAEISAEMQRSAPARVEPGIEGEASLVAVLLEQGERLNQLVETTKELAKNADEEGFRDVKQNVDSLLQQLLAVRNRIGQLRRSFS